MSDSAVVQTLRAAREIVADSETWTQGWYAKDAEGCDVGRFGELDDIALDGCKFCATGALIKVEADRGEVAWPEGTRWENTPAGLLEVSARELYDKSAPAVNDEDGQEAALEVYDAAIERAQALGL